MTATGMNLPGTSKVPKVLSGNTPNDRDMLNAKVGSCTATVQCSRCLCIYGRCPHFMGYMMSVMWRTRGGEDSGVAKVNKDMVGYPGYGLS